MTHVRPSFRSFLLNRSLLILSLGAALSLAAACGDNNPYGSKPTKCKVDCGGESDAIAKDVPRGTNTVVLAITSLDGGFNRSAQPNAALVKILQLNPFVELEAALLSVKASADQAAAHKAKRTPGAGARCYFERFTAPAKRVRTHTQLSADFGKCVSLAALTQQLNKTKPSGDANLYRMGEYEQAFSAVLPSPSSLKPASVRAVTPANAVAWGTAFPFRALTADDVAIDDEGKFKELGFQFSLVGTKTIETWAEQKQVRAMRSRSLSGAGYSTNEAGLLRAQFKDNGQTLTLNGSLYLAQDTVLNPNVATPTTGEQATGFTAEVAFQDFVMTNDDGFALDARLGFSRQAKIAKDAKYFVLVNAPFAQNAPEKDTKYPGTRVFLMNGKGIACVMDAFEVVSTQRIEAVGSIDLCR